jgi:hypothetical protein
MFAIIAAAAAVCWRWVGPKRTILFFFLSFFSKGRSCVVRKLFKAAYHEKLEEIMPQQNEKVCYS